ncbi:hypothetical protein BT96DRAFT_1097416 [Gymnopus androsaceus JB14]|uniref:Uncharacterized protein n=1 Tax=Gymnopus androsaceus JB14 TaxID=1447944 RepID=A0A6A4GGB2_9AGAR|nr:hypothetical protein BT96DRAFT_1097416 [Gymnopus androsaceus JB14]
MKKSISLPPGLHCKKTGGKDLRRKHRHMPKHIHFARRLKPRSRKPCVLTKLNLNLEVVKFTGEWQVDERKNGLTATGIYCVNQRTWIWKIGSKKTTTRMAWNEIIPYGYRQTESFGKQEGEVAHGTFWLDAVNSISSGMDSGLKRGGCETDASAWLADDTSE